jgi:hypothetical protein
VGLAGENQLQGPIALSDQPEDPIRVAQDEIGSLVGGEAPGKTDCQRVWIEQEPTGNDLYGV